MTAEGLPDSERVEYRVFVDKDRAKMFRAELGELAASYSGEIIDPTQKRRLAIATNWERNAPVRPFREDMTSLINDAKTGGRMAVVTQEDFRQFGLQHGYDATLVTRAYRGMTKFSTASMATPSGQPTISYIAKGSLVNRDQLTDPSDTVQQQGFRVDNLEHLARELIFSRNKVRNFGTRSQELLNHFVEELFPYDQE